MFEKKGTMKARNEKTETGKISERRKNLQRELVALEPHDIRLVCRLYATICSAVAVYMTLGKVVPTSTAPVPGFSEFFAL